MNERIRQLALQAFDKANNGAISDIKIPKQFIEKFAELIVEECLDILDDEDDGSHDGRSVRIAAIRIKKHFGVEE